MRVKPFCWPTNHNREGCWRCHPGESGAINCRMEDFEEECVVFSGYRISNTKTDVCDVKKKPQFGNNKSAKLKGS